MLGVMFILYHDIGAAFTFPLDPMARHRLAVEIKKEEVKRHGDDWRTCVRRSGQHQGFRHLSRLPRSTWLSEEGGVQCGQDDEEAV